MASEEHIEGFLAEDGNNIVMILESGNAAVCIERDTVVQQLLNNTDNYYYLCRGEYEVKDACYLQVSVHITYEIPVFGLGFVLSLEDCCGTTLSTRLRTQKTRYL